jgi:hypothetical protein
MYQESDKRLAVVKSAGIFLIALQLPHSEERISFLLQARFRFHKHYNWHRQFNFDLTSTQQKPTTIP